MIDPAFLARLRASCARGVVATRQALDLQALLGMFTPAERAELVAAVDRELMERATLLDELTGQLAKPDPLPHIARNY